MRMEMMTALTAISRVLTVKNPTMVPMTHRMSQKFNLYLIHN